jgi:predicted secreted protein
MTSFEYIMIYTLTWWMMLFILLPVGAKPAEEGGVAYASAPKQSYLKRKLLGATLLAIPMTLMVSWVIESRILL